jgi:hypothetical protein
MMGTMEADPMDTARARIKEEASAMILHPPEGVEAITMVDTDRLGTQTRILARSHH